MKAQAGARAMRAVLWAGILMLLATMTAGAAEDTATGDTATGDRRYTFAFYDMPLIDALDLLSARSGRGIAVSGPAQQAPIDARFVAVSFEKALGAILRSRQHVIVSFADGSIEVQLLDAPAGADPAGFEAGSAAGDDLGLFPLSDEVIVPEKPEGIGFRPGGLSLDAAGGAGAAAAE